MTYTCSTKTLKAANFKGHLAGNADSATKATQDTNGRAFTNTNAYMHISALANNTDFNNVKTTGIYYCTGNTYSNRPHNSWGILTVYSIGTVKQEYRPDDAAVYYTREYDNAEWKAWSKVNAANADTATNASHATNADSATTATNVSGKIYYSSDSPSVATNKLFTVKQAHKGDDNVPNNGLVIQSGPTGAAYNGKLYITDNGGDGVWIGGVASGKEVGWTRLVENKGSWNINSATATNADKLDGYHASDLFRHLGGNQTPVITDIFDRAGTIDMSTMSAADKATHKANINKAPNMTQDIWNNGSGIHAYGGDADIAGYNRGTLKLTQSYKNFDKILVVGVNDRGDLLIYKLWDVWALANAFASGSHFQLFHGGDYWFLYGSTRKGTNTNYVLSTDTVWSCQDQNSGIIAIYGIKY